MSIFKRKRTKWSPAQIEQRFDAAALRFSGLDEGQQEIVDVQLMRTLIVEAAAKTCPEANQLLDVGCGAGFYTVALLERLPRLNVTLLDISENMLLAAKQNVLKVSREVGAEGVLSIRQSDIREVELPDESFDIIVSAAALHHLRGESEWHEVFEKLFNALTPGGSLWIADLVASDVEEVQEIMLESYTDYLEQQKLPEKTETILEHIEQEDSPRSLVFQLELLREVGFEQASVLHKNSCFAAFGAVKNS